MRFRALKLKNFFNHSEDNKVDFIQKSFIQMRFRAWAPPVHFVPPLCRVLVPGRKFRPSPTLLQKVIGKQTFGQFYVVIKFQNVRFFKERLAVGTEI